MSKNILLVGLKEGVVDEARQQLHMPGFQIFGGTGIEDVRKALTLERIDAVIMGGGIDLETRLEIVREIFHLSQTTTVHMKDVASGSEGFLPFVRSMLHGLGNAA